MLGAAALLFGIGRHQANRSPVRKTHPDHRDRKHAAHANIGVFNGNRIVFRDRYSAEVARSLKTLVATPFQSAVERLSAKPSSFPWLAAVETPQREQDLTRLAPKRGLIAAQPVEGIGRQIGQADKGACEIVGWICRLRRRSRIRIKTAVWARRHPAACPLPSRRRFGTCCR